MNSTNDNYSDLIENYNQFHQIYNLQQSYVMRKKIHFTFILIRYTEFCSLSYMQYVQLLRRQLRHSDFAFVHKKQQYVVILLSLSKVDEAKSFIQRLKRVLPDVNMPLSGCITEVAGAHYSLDDVLSKSEEKLLEHAFTNEEFIIVNDFLTKDPETIKVSIVENDEIILSIFSNLFTNLETPNCTLDIQTFKDGLEFTTSGWYRSGHNHIIVLNDILPKKNGLEVLKYLRSLPNEQKYIILFISTRVSEEAQLECFENGADAYFVRPFNLKIVEMKIKNYIRRLS